MEGILRVSLLPDGFLSSAIVGDLSAENLPTLKDDVEKGSAFIKNEFAKHGSQKFKSLIDLSAFSGTYVPDAMLVLAEYEKNNAPYIEKSAGFGGAPSTHFAAEIVSALALRDNIKFFKTRDEALAWLGQ